MLGNYSVNPLNDAAWLCYINGLEIPTVGVQMHFGVWQMPTCTITLVPHPMLQRIGHEDRLQVALFYLDNYYNPEDPYFKLYYEFEVVGWAYTNTPRGRSLQLSCVSHDQILEQLKFFFISSLNDIVENINPTPETVSTAKIMYPASLFMEGLIYSPDMNSAAENAPPNSVGSAAKQAPEDASIDADAAATEKEVDAIMASMDAGFELGQVSPDDFVKRPVDFVLNIFRSILAVPKEGEDQQVMESGYLPTSAASCPGKNFFARWFKMTGYHKRWVSLPLFEVFPGPKRADGSTMGGCFPLIRAVQDTQALPAISQQIGQSVGYSGSAWELLKQVFGYMYEEIAFIPAPPAVTIKKQQGDIVSHPRQKGDNLERALASRCVKPQCTFALPPVCNIVFPSMIKQYTFNENYITQPTRLYLGEEFISKVLQPQSADMSALMKKMITTGYPEPVRKRLELLATDPTKNNKNMLLWPEEFYKGPVSTQLNAPPWMYMLEQQYKGSDNDSKTPEEVDIEKQLEAIVGTEEAAVMGSLFDKYAEYEFFRARYSERQGAVSMAFNPYVVPGFPMMVFDQKGVGVSTLGYVNSLDVSWTATSGSPAMDTDVGLTFMRTLAESLCLLGSVSSQSKGLDMGPVEVIPEVAVVFQLLLPAHDFYSKLFFQNQKLKQAAVFDWRSMVKFVRYDGRVLDPKVPDDVAKFSQDMTVYPRPEYEPMFDSYSAAMTYIARPGCTLGEYAEIMNGGKNLGELINNGTVKGEHRSFYSPTKDSNKSAGAVFWARIYKLKQGPGAEPPQEVTNIGDEASDYPPAPSWKVIDASTGAAQTRLDWDAILEEYRKIVRGEEGRIAPQI